MRGWNEQTSLLPRRSHLRGAYLIRSADRSSWIFSRTRMSHGELTVARRMESVPHDLPPHDALVQLETERAV